jgi:hypothetical protein
MPARNALIVREIHKRSKCLHKFCKFAERVRISPQAKMLTNHISIICPRPLGRIDNVALSAGRLHSGIVSTRIFPLSLPKLGARSRAWGRVSRTSTLRSKQCITQSSPQNKHDWMQHAGSNLIENRFSESRWQGRDCTGRPESKNNETRNQKQMSHIITTPCYGISGAFGRTITTTTIMPYGDVTSQCPKPLRKGRAEPLAKPKQNAETERDLRVRWVMRETLKTSSVD